MQVQNLQLGNEIQADIQPVIDKSEQKNPLQNEQKKKQIIALYKEIKQKLREVFTFYMRQKKMKSFTLDDYNSMDIKNFANYCKHFKFNEIIKINDITKYFKKIAQNGTWLHQQQFGKINFIIANLPVNIHLFIQQFNLSAGQAIQSNDINALEQLNVKINDIFSKLKQLSLKLDRKEINKLVGRSCFKMLNGRIQVMKNQKLKSMIEGHTGVTYEKDVLQKLKQRKKQKELKYEIKINKMLEKYKIKQNSAVTSQHKTNAKSNRSSHSYQVEMQRENDSINSANHHHKVENSCLSSRQANSLKNMQLISHNGQQSKIKKKKVASQKSTLKQRYKELSLPKLTKKKLREMSIYQQLKLIDTKKQFEAIKDLLSGNEQKNTKQDRQIFREYYMKQQLLKGRDKNKKVTVQSRMKFT